MAGEMLIERFLTHVEYLTDEDRQYLTDTARASEDEEDEEDEEDKALLPHVREERWAAERLKHTPLRLKNHPAGLSLACSSKPTFYLGTMVRVGWIGYELVKTTLKDAVAHWTDQPKTLQTLTACLDAGVKKPHGPLRALDPDVAQINKDYALVVIRNRAAILKPNEPPHRVAT